MQGLAALSGLIPGSFLNACSLAENDVEQRRLAAPAFGAASWERLWLEVPFGACKPSVLNPMGA
jgi:hypothetical protein